MSRIDLAPRVSAANKALGLGRRIKDDISNGKKPICSDEDWLFIYRALMLLATTGAA